MDAFQPIEMHNISKIYTRDSYEILKQILYERYEYVKTKVFYQQVN